MNKWLLWQAISRLYLEHQKSWVEMEKNTMKVARFLIEEMHSLRWRDILYKQKDVKHIRNLELEKRKYWRKKHVSMKNIKFTHIPNHSNVFEHRHHLLDRFYAYPLNITDQLLNRLRLAILTHDRSEVEYIDVTQSEGKTKQDRKNEKIAIKKVFKSLYKGENLEKIVQINKELSRKWELHQALKVYEEMSHIDWVVYLQKAWYDIKDEDIQKHLDRLRAYSYKDIYHKAVIDYMYAEHPDLIDIFHRFNE